MLSTLLDIWPIKGSFPALEKFTFYRQLIKYIEKKIRIRVSEGKYEWIKMDEK